MVDIESTSIINYKRIEELKNINPNNSQELLNKFKKLFMGSLEPIQKSLESGDVFQLNSSEKVSLFHKLAGISVNIGAEKLSLYAKYLQKNIPDMDENTISKNVSNTLSIIRETIVELDRL